jgi:zona occludens toxin
MIYLITATPGSGKTLWAVKEIFARVNEAEPWNIFSNIDGLKLDTAQPLKDSFNDYPPRSLVVIDEAQKITHFSKKYRHPNKNEMHPEVEFLQTHRHAEFLDIIYITQAPRLLNPDVLDMVGTHIHLHRPMGMKMATWWLWKYHQLNPNTKSTKADAEDSGTFTYPKHLFDMYKSSNGGTDSHGKIKIPMKIINAIWMLLLILGVTGWLYVKNGGLESTGVTEKEATEQETIKDKIPEQTAKDLPPMTDLNQDCRKGVNVERPECVEWFNNYSNATATTSAQATKVSYNANDPYSFHPESFIEVKDYPRLTGCARDLQGRYRGIDQQGNIMPQISQSDCKRWLNGERLFDYTRDPNKVTSNAPVLTQTDNKESRKPDIQEVEKQVPKVDAEVKAEQIPLGTPVPREITGANSI